MLPIILGQQDVSVGLAGTGEGHARRASLLAGAGVTPVAVVEAGPLPDIRLLFVAGLNHGSASTLAGRAREARILVNVEDMPELCDFHVPAIVRRGDLLLTVSTGGRAPGLARRLREWLGRQFGPEWSARLEDMGQARAGWRAQGLQSNEVAERSRTMISQKGWLL